MLISRTIRKKNQPDGYRLVVNSVYRVNRNRDYAVYQDLCMPSFLASQQRARTTDESTPARQTMAKR